MPAEVTEQELKEFLDLDKINYTKAEKLTSKKDGRVLELEIKDDTEAVALITENVPCPITGIIYRVEEFPTSVSVQQCWNCLDFGHSSKPCRSKTKRLICDSRNHKGCPKREKAAMLHPTKGVQHSKAGI